MKNKKNVLIIALSAVVVLLAAVLVVLFLNGKKTKTELAALHKATEADLLFVDPEAYFGETCKLGQKGEYENDGYKYYEIWFDLPLENVNMINDFAAKIVALNDAITLEKTVFDDYYSENGYFGVYKDGTRGPAVDLKNGSERAFLILWTDLSHTHQDRSGYRLKIRYPFKAILQTGGSAGGDAAQISAQASEQIPAEAPTQAPVPATTAEPVRAASFPDGSFPDPKAFFGEAYLSEEGQNSYSIETDFQLPDRDISVFEDYLNLFSDERLHYRTAKDEEWSYSYGGKKYTAYDVFYTGSKSISTFDNVYTDGLALVLTFVEDGPDSAVMVQYTKDLTPVDVGVYSRYAAMEAAAQPAANAGTQQTGSNSGSSGSQSGGSMCMTCHGVGKLTETCSSCHGSGNGQNCFTCHGKGRVDCTSCGGKGYSYNLPNDSKNKCFACNGSGDKECSACRGSGKRTCTTCNGRGKTERECPACRGSGRS